MGIPMHEHPSIKMKLFLLFTVVLLALLPAMRSQIPRARTLPHPLCNSQLALANYACANLPLSPMPPPSSPMIEPPSSPPPERSRPRDELMNLQEVECCRWLREVDHECVCDLLVSLPTFLSRPNHAYTLVVNQTCAVSYRCGGRLKP